LHTFGSALVIDCRTKLINGLNRPLMNKLLPRCISLDGPSLVVRCSIMDPSAHMDPSVANLALTRCLVVVHRQVHKYLRTLLLPKLWLLVFLYSFTSSSTIQIVLLLNTMIIIIDHVFFTEITKIK
jgi:hypothetical protein